MSRHMGTVPEGTSEITSLFLSLKDANVAPRMVSKCQSLCEDCLPAPCPPPSHTPEVCARMTNASSLALHICLA